MANEPIDEKAVFNSARQIASSEERAAYLQQVCGHDPAALQRILDLLRIFDEEKSFLESPAVVPGATVADPVREDAGTEIGRYKLIQQIGEGGMGSVWMAQQTEPVRRLVALKLIKAGMDSKQVIARFEAERQALALMDHVNIARVMDAGTTSSGRPYFVMDLVKGVPITKYCDDHRLTPRQRLELFIPVCQAIQHAHQKGIIHRDIKPSNVLVALYDGRPVPKVIDFGVAKAAGQPLTDKTLVTGFGSVVGTLEYMSPEQAEMNQLDIDTRSDIYSLGALLYELLAGTPPFTNKELEKAGVLELLRMIREQEPSRPSAKLSSSDALPTLSANRGTEPGRLTSALRGELDWIVMKALEKDRGRRYETANGFAMDVQRYLADEPVQACPPSVGYRLRKFARRNKAMITVASVVLAVLILGILGTSWQAIRATNAEDRTRAEKVTADHARQAADRSAAEAEKKAKEADESLLLLGKEKAETDRLLDLSRRHLFTAQLRVVAGLVEEDPAQAWRLLNDCNACPLHLRDFAWGSYALRCQRERLTYRYDAPPIFSPTDGNTYAIVNDVTVEIRDRDSGRLLHSLPHEERELLGIEKVVRFSPDGTRLLVLDRPELERPGALKIWNVQSGTLEATIPGVRRFWPSPDASLLVVSSAGSPEPVQLVEKTGKAGPQLRGHTAGLDTLIFAPDGKTFATTTKAEVKLWAASGTLMVELSPGSVCTFTPDAQRLIAGHGNVIELRDPASGKIVKTIADVAVGGYQLSPDGALLAFGRLGKASELALWDLRAGKVVATLPRPAEATWRFSPDGSHLVLLCRKPSQLQLWQMPGRGQGERCTHVRTFEHPEGMELWRTDGRVAVGVGRLKSVEIWDLATGKLRTRLSHRPNDTPTVHLSPDGRTVLTGIKMWDITPEPGCTILGDVVPVYDAHRYITSYNRYHPASDPTLVPAGGTLAYRSEGRLHLRDLASETTGLQLDKVSAFALSRDEKTLASSDAGGAVTLRDAHTGKVRTVLEKLPGPPHQLHFSGDDSLLVTVLLGRVPKQELKGQERVRVPPRADGPNPKPAPEPLGEIKVWEVSSGKLRATLPGHSKSIYRVAFSPVGDLLVVASDDGAVRLWDVRTAALRATLKGLAWYLGFTPDGRRLVAWLGSSETDSPSAQRAQIHEVSTGKLLSQFPLLARSASGGLGTTLLGSTPDGDGLVVAVSRFDTIISSWESSEVQLLDAVSGKVRMTLKGADGPVAFSPDGKTIACASGYRERKPWLWNAQEIKLFDALTGQDRGTLTGHFQPITSLAFTPDSRTLISGDGKTIRLWRSELGPNPVLLREDTLRNRTGGGERTLAISADGRTFAAADHRQIEVLDLTTGQLRVTISGDFDQRPLVSLSNNGGLLAITAAEGKGENKQPILRLWNARTGESLGTLACPVPVVRRGMFFSADGKRLQVLFADGTIRGWSVATWEALSPERARADFPRRYLFKLSGGTDPPEYNDHVTEVRGKGSIEVVDLAQGKSLFTLTGHQSPVCGVAVHPGQKQIASAGGLWRMYRRMRAFTYNSYIPGELRLWDLTTGKEVAAHTYFPDPIQHLSYSPDGKLLVAASQRDVPYLADILLWEADTLRLVGRIRVPHVTDLAFTPDGRSLVFCTEESIELLSLERLLGTASAALPMPGSGKQR